jgi:LysM repeat protein
MIKDGDLCSVYVAKYPGVTLADLISWNPDIGSQCTNLQVGSAICVSVEGFVPKTTIVTMSTTTAKPTTTSIPGAVPPPGPTQDGVAPNCNRWDLVGADTTCDTFTKKYAGLILANLVSWNPAIGEKCTNMWQTYYICTSVVGFTMPTKVTTSSTKPTATSTVPSPVQSGINPNCKKYHKVVDKDTCFDIAKKYAITLADFYKWNPSVKNDCSGKLDGAKMGRDLLTNFLGLWLNTYVCVGG